MQKQPDTYKVTCFMKTMTRQRSGGTTVFSDTGGEPGSYSRGKIRSLGHLTLYIKDPFQGDIISMLEIHGGLEY